MIESKRKTQGRPPVYEETGENVTFVLFPRHKDYLKRLTFRIYDESEAETTKSGIVRALIDALYDSKIKLSEAKSEAELRQILTKKLKS